jgi:hypothetical protein
MYYIIITHSIYSNKTLRDGAKILYGLLLSLSQKDGFCYADNSYLSNTLNVEPRTVQIYLKQLRDQQYIHIDIKDNHVRRITTQDTRVKLAAANKTPLEMKKRALKQISEPEWLNDYMVELVKME